MTYLELKTMFANYVDDVNFGYYTESFAGILLNKAVKEVHKILIANGEQRYMICKETDTVVNQDQYVIPEDFHSVASFNWVENPGTTSEVEHPIDFITPNQRYHNNGYPSSSSNATNYTVKRNRLWVFPTPAAVYRLRLYYNFLLAEMTLDSDEPDIQENYQELIVLYAVRDAFIKDDRESQKILDKINRYETEMKNDAQERRKDSPRYVKVTEGDYFF